MEVLVFANPKDVSKERFLQKISKLPSISAKFILQRSLFKSALIQKALDWRVVVIFVYDQDGLAMTLSFKEYLAGSRVILVLHQTDSMTIKQSLSISPCFITNASGDFSDVIAVLEKVSKLGKKGINGEDLNSDLF